MIRKLDRFYTKRSRTALTLMIILASVVLYAADQADRENSAALRLRWAASVRGGV
jgi:hypothetical protein